LFISLSRPELPVFTCSCTTDPPPLLEAAAGVVRAVLVVKRDNVTAAAMNSNVLFEYIVILLIQVLLIGFENATSGFQILNNYLIIMSRIINYLDLPVFVIARIMDFIINGVQNIL
jgi:hypothetical protein